VAERATIARPYAKAAFEYARDANALAAWSEGLKTAAEIVADPRVAPLTKSSGKTRRVLRRHACHRRLANAVYHWARIATQHDRTSRAKYAALRARGIDVESPSFKPLTKDEMMARLD